MNNLNFKGFYKIAVFMVLLLVFSHSCKANDPVILEYVGTWVTVNYLGTPDGFSWFKEIYTFTESTFSRLLQIQLPDEKWVDFDSSKGTMTVNGKIINFTENEVGRTSYNANTGLPNGEITRYSAGSVVFDHYLLEIAHSLEVPSEWSVSGNHLTNKTDYNLDGDFLDKGETKVYTRQ